MKLGIYQHWKKKFYRVICVAKNSETLEDYVVYEVLLENKTNRFWVRPMKMFLEKVESNGKMVPRFKFVKEQS